MRYASELRLIALMAALALTIPCLAHAGTVTLTGTCQGEVDGNTLQFSLSNSGNDTPYYLQITPHLQLARTERQMYMINSITPGSTNATTMSLVNVTANGSYADFFSVLYQQGTDTFMGMFPCVISFNGGAPFSMLKVSANYTAASSNSVRVRVSVFNYASYSIDANVSLILPPIFSSAGAQANVTLGAYKNKTMTFVVPFPSTGQNAYTIGAAASYASSGKNVASLYTFSIAKPGVGTGSASNLLLYGAVAAIAAVVVLIGVAAFRNFKKGKGAQSAQPTVSGGQATQQDQGQ